MEIGEKNDFSGSIMEIVRYGYEYYPKTINGLLRRIEIAEDKNKEFEIISKHYSKLMVKGDFETRAELISPFLAFMIVWYSGNKKQNMEENFKYMIDRPYTSLNKEYASCLNMIMEKSIESGRKTVDEYEKDIEIESVLNPNGVSPNFLKICLEKISSIPVTPTATFELAIKDITKDRAIDLYKKLNGKYIKCDQNTFLHFFYDSKISNDEKKIEWMYSSKKAECLLFLHIITTSEYEDNENQRPLKKVNEAFQDIGKGKIKSSVVISTNSKLKRELKSILN